MNWEMIWQVLRYLLLMIGPALVARGWTTESGWMEIVAAIGTVGAFVWGLYVKYGTRAVPKDVTERRDVPTVSGATGTITK